QRRLSAYLDGDRNPLGVELIAGELLQSACNDTTANGRLYRSSQLEWYARRIDDARLAMDDDYAAEHSLDRLARSAGMSPFHFARIFRELVGMPPHRYLV